MFLLTKTIFKKLSKKNITNFINDLNNFDNIDKKNKVNQFIFVNDKKNKKESLIKINLDVKQDILKIDDKVNSRNKKFMNFALFIVTKHFSEKIK